MAELAIVLVNWNNREYLLTCVQSILDHAPCRPYEIWLVDDASVDGSAAAMRERFPQVRLIENKTKVGFTIANNQILKQCQATFLLLLNVDTVVHEGALDAMCDYLEANPDCGAVACKLLNRDGTVQRSAWHNYPSVKSVLADALYLWRLFPSQIAGSELVYTYPKEPIDVDHLLGACLMTTRAVVDKVGLLDEDYKIYLSDTEWCRRMQRMGYRIVYAPAKTITHYGQGAMHNAPVQSLTSWNESLVHFVRTTARPGATARVFVVKTALAIGAVLRMGLWTLRMRNDEKHSKGMRAGYTRVLRELTRY